MAGTDQIHPDPLGYSHHTEIQQRGAGQTVRTARVFVSLYYDVWLCQAKPLHFF